MLFSVNYKALYARIQKLFQEGPTVIQVCRGWVGGGGGRLIARLSLC